MTAIRTTAVASSSSSTSLSLTIPNTVQVGDTMVLAVVAAFFPMAPTGWTVIKNNASEFANYTLCWKIATISDPGAVLSLAVLGGTQDVVALLSVAQGQCKVYAWQATQVQTATNTATINDSKAVDLIMWFGVPRTNVAGTVATCSRGVTDQTATTANFGAILTHENAAGVMTATVGSNNAPLPNFDTFAAGVALTANAPFPQGALDIKTEALFGTTWTDITRNTYARAGNVIHRGRQSEGASSDVSTNTFQINNRSGNFSPRNPMGAYYGLIGRNTQCRTSIPSTTGTFGNIPLGVNNNIITNDKAALRITGNIELQADVWFDSWGAQSDIIGRFANPSNWSYSFYNNAGYISIHWTTDGTSGTYQRANSTAKVPIVCGRLAVKVTLQVNNGAGGNTATFYTAPTIAGPWTQLGNPVVQTGTTSIFAGTANLQVGDALSGGRFGGKVYAAKVLNGIAGTTVASPDFTVQGEGTPSFVDAQANVWYIGGNATITGTRNYRHWGEISEWPSKWDVTGKDVYTPVTSSGIFRRLGQGAKALKSAYYRGCTSTTAPVSALVAYWPCEDSVGTTTIASGQPSGLSMSISGSPVMATDTTSFPCSGALPTMGTASFTGKIDGYTDTGQIQLRLLCSFPTGGIANNTVLFTLLCNGSARAWSITYTTGGNLTLNAYSITGATLLNSTVAFAVNGQSIRLGLQLTQSGANVNTTMSTLVATANAGLSNSVVLNSQTIGPATSITIAPNKDCANLTVGHITVQNAVGSAFDLTNLLAANAGETPAARITRLCTEENIPVQVIGDDSINPDPATQMTMGFQLQKTLLDLIREAEATDGGILYETRGMFGIGFRTLASLASQSADLTVNYAAADMSAIEPVEDDRYIVNDMTASRAGGSSFRYTQTSGTLSTQSPPNGVGTYDTSLTFSALNDQLLKNIACWRVHVGTIDEPRFPALGFKLVRSNFATNAAQMAAVVALDIGDRVVITNPPAWMPPENISQLSIGTDETLNALQFDFSIVGMPESPYHIGIYDDGVSRYTSDGTTTTDDAAAGATTVNVVTVQSGPLWDVSDGSYDLMISGERVTVTAVGLKQILYNYTFDAGIQDWGVNTFGTLSWDTTVKRTGAGSLKITATSAAGWNAAESGTVKVGAVLPGENLTWSAWCRVNTNRNFQTILDYSDINGVYVSSSAFTTQAGTANTWVQIVASDIVPPTCYGVQMTIIDNSTAVGQIMNVDDISFTANRHQAFTVTRAVNGIAKLLPAGSTVQLFSPSYFI